MKRITTLGKVLNVLSFYRWAFGDLTEQDSDIGMLAEYLVGDILHCLPPTRKVNAPFDLIMKDGTSLEIKATTHKCASKGRTPYYRWDVSTQAEMLKGNRPIADYWAFLIASFPRETSRTPRVMQASTPRTGRPMSSPARSCERRDVRNMSRSRPCGGLGSRRFR